MNTTASATSSQVQFDAPVEPRTTRLKYTHEAMIDMILEEPGVRPQELAKLFNYSAGWINRVLASDSFQARLAERKAKLVDPHISHTLNERLRGVAVQAISIIEEKLDSEQSASYAMEALGLATRGMNTAAKR